MENCKYCIPDQIRKSEYTLQDHTGECYCGEEICKDKEGNYWGEKSGLPYSDNYEPGLDRYNSSISC